MRDQFSLRRLFHLVRPAGAELYIVIVLWGLAGSISLMRFLQSRINFPYHQWDEPNIPLTLREGLLLFTAIQSPLVLASKCAFSASAFTSEISQPIRVKIRIK